MNWIRTYLENKEFKPGDGVYYWREKILRNILLVLCISGLGAYIFGVYLAIANKIYTVAIADTLAYGFLIFLFFTDLISVKNRIYIILATIFSLGIALTLTLGPFGAGLIYLVAFSMLTSILLGTKAANRSILINTILLIIIGIIIEFNWLPKLLISDYSTIGWFTVCINVIVISSISSIPLASLVKGLKNTIDVQRELQLLLKEKIGEIAVAKNKAEEADMLKTTFLANMSHEIRTPLNAILGFSDLIQNEPDFNENEKNEFLKTINESGHYLMDIIENILDISMIESNQLKYTLSNVNLSTIINDLKSIYDPRIKKLESVDLSFPQIIKQNDFVFTTDAQRLKQVFINLINNALKFTHKGVIKTGYAIRNNYIEFFVSDTGTGICNDEKENVFSRFVKSKDATEGTGLGLPISKGIIEALGGKIWFKSNIKEGTTFYFTVPYKKAIQDKS